jgi:hypothetical protein
MSLRKSPRYHYENVSGDDCYYCGDVATVRDHALPLSYSNRVAITDAERALLILIPACPSCNGTLGARVFDSLEARCRYVAEHLAQKHRRLLARGDWTPEELADLGPTLKGRVSDLQRRRAAIAARIAHAVAKAENEEFPTRSHQIDPRPLHGPQIGTQNACSPERVFG